MFYSGSIVHEGYEEEISGFFDSEIEFVKNAHVSNHGREYISIVVDRENSSVEYSRENIEFWGK